jgi:hypothetical protein
LVVNDKIVDFLLIAAIGLSAFFIGQQTVNAVPSCMEDDVIVGVGNFRNGYWSDGYKCINFEEVN